MIDFLDSYRLWADTHVFFDAPPQVRTSQEPLPEQASRWCDRLTHDTPNGLLLTRNSLFDVVRPGRVVPLLHVTHAMERISDQGALYPSGGCMVGCLYGTPLTPVDDGYRMHNLGEYVLCREAPEFVKRIGGAAGQPTPLVIEVTIPPDAYHGLAGIDYLRLGEIHLQIFLHLEYLLSCQERNRLRETIVRRIKNSTPFLRLCTQMVRDGSVVGPEMFFRLLDQAIPRLPILGYLYFEAVAEYVMLHSTTTQTRLLMDRGELNNWLYKRILFTGFPEMAGGFDLSKFRPSQPDLARLLADADPTLDTTHAMSYLAERLTFLVNARLFGSPLVPEVWHHTRWEFDELRQRVGPLMGHLIHRELRTFGRYPDFYFYYDQYKALQAWNYWNHMDIVTPFNGTIPKGEIGVNPAYPDLRYRILSAELDDRHLLRPVEELELTIVPRLVDIKYTLMRNNKWDSEMGRVS